jgi:CheY-like chemotaxis protein
MAKILVIDDSAFMRKYVRELLEAAAFEVEEFLPLSALEALERIRLSAPDLILSDYNMPDVDGQSVARMAKKANPSLPVVILTAVRDASREATLTKLGVTRILHKPIEAEALVKAIQEILEKK